MDYQAAGGWDTSPLFGQLHYHWPTKLRKMCKTHTHTKVQQDVW